MINIGKTGEIGGKWLPHASVMQDKPPITTEKRVFIVEKQDLNSHKTMSFTVSKELLIGGIKKDVGKQKTEKRNNFWEGKERENSSDFGEGDSP